MSWTILGALLRAASLVKREPERSALSELGREVARLHDEDASPVSSR